MNTRESQKILVAFESSELNREGYWGCSYCGSHVPTTYHFCTTCHKLHWRLRVPQESIPAGPPTTLTQNRVYALPSVTVWINSSAALQFSQDASAWTADVAASVTGMQSSYAFCRCVTASPIVTCRRY
jgi:hypothetical protein